ncbi:hypothetical protein ACIQSP_16595 [Streptomyces nigra]|uniref:hypothetical protein n=1 Tax=Streptomyces nigra TaxID=1827580 RepID=UPI00380CF4BB
MPQPADTLRAAADKLRALLAALPADRWNGRPWHAEECSDTDDMSPCPCIVAQGEYREFDQPQIPLIQYVADAETPEHAAYIAAMHPGVGTALADSLDSAAELAASYPDLAREHDRAACDDYACDLMGRSLALARAVNAAG